MSDLQNGDKIKILQDCSCGCPLKKNKLFTIKNLTNYSFELLEESKVPRIFIDQLGLLFEKVMFDPFTKKPFTPTKSGGYSITLPNGLNLDDNNDGTLFGIKGFDSIVCEHEYVNMGFTSMKMVCKKCNKEQN
jgi:hypothetical protein